MNKGIEFIKKFVISNKQERLIWELESPRKRKELFWRFSGSNIFKDGCLQETDYMTNDELEVELYRLSKTKVVYFIGESYVGELSLKEAVVKASFGEICVIYCGNGIGYYQGEEDRANTPRYFLIQP